MRFDKPGWVRFLIQQKVLKFGDFTLKDGTKSPFFLDFGEVCTGRALREMGIHFCQRIEETVSFEGINFLYGPPYKATLMAATTAMGVTTQEMPCLFTRKEIKMHGEAGFSYGYIPKAGDSYLLIDDVITNGDSKAQALQNLSGHLCRGVVVGVDRQVRVDGRTASARFTAETGVPVVSLVTLEELADMSEGLVSPAENRALRGYLAR